MRLSVGNEKKGNDMEINKAKLERVVETAKAKAAGNKRWLAAIDKAVDGLLGNAWIVTELVEGLLITTESGETYHANGACQCKAYQVGQACKHRAAARLVAMMNEEAAPVASLPATVDYTQKPAGGRIVPCPTCGRNGLAERKQFGDMAAPLLVAVVHTGSVDADTLEVTVLDRCEVVPAQRQQEIADVCAADLARASARAARPQPTFD